MLQLLRCRCHSRQQSHIPANTGGHLENPGTPKVVASFKSLGQSSEIYAETNQPGVQLPDIFIHQKGLGNLDNERNPPKGRL